MNIDNPTQDDVVEAATIGGAALLLAGTALSVYTGILEVPMAAEITLIALAALGLHEGGRRRGKKSAIIKWGLNQLDDAGEQQGAQDATESTDSFEFGDSDSQPDAVDRSAETPAGPTRAGSESSESDPRSPPSAEGQAFAKSVLDNVPSQTGTPASHTAAESQPQTGASDEQVREAIERADYATLRQVATIVEGAQGAGEGNTLGKMREDLRAADPAAVADAFESVTANRTDGSG